MRGDQRRKRMAGVAELRQSRSSAISSDMHQRRRAEGADAAVLHDLELALARLAAAEAVGDIGDSPSSCRQPVTSIAAASATSAASAGGRPSQAPTAKATPPTSADDGAGHGRRPDRLGEACASPKPKPAAGSRVKKPRQSAMSAPISLGVSCSAILLSPRDGVEEGAGDVAAPAAERAERLALAVGDLGQRLVVAGLDHLRVVEFVAADRRAGRARAGSRRSSRAWR